jgi:hypothetical protein
MNIKELKEKIAHLPDDLEVYGTAGKTEQGGGIYDFAPRAAVYNFDDDCGIKSNILLISCNHHNDENSCCGTMEELSDGELAEINYAAAKKDLHSRVAESIVSMKVGSRLIREFIKMYDKQETVGVASVDGKQVEDLGDFFDVAKRSIKDDLNS